MSDLDDLIQKARHEAELAREWAEVHRRRQEHEEAQAQEAVVDGWNRTVQWLEEQA